MQKKGYFINLDGKISDLIVTNYELTIYSNDDDSLIKFFDDCVDKFC